LQVQRGELDGKDFTDGIAAFMESIVQSNAAPKPEYADLFPQTKKQAAEGMQDRLADIDKQVEAAKEELV
jgi:hypothetical protein